jgi:hypothetical protein
MARFPDIFTAFRESVEKREPQTRKILIATSDDVKDPGDGWIFERGEDPFCFSRIANRGISLADSDDVLLCNDDVTFDYPVTYAMAKVAHSHPRIGILSPKIRGAAKNPFQRTGIPLPSEPTFVGDMVAFVCVYLKRTMLADIGGLDERFTFSWEDDDYCRRALKAGWLVAVTGETIVNHGYNGGRGSETMMRRGDYAQCIAENRRRFDKKWAAPQP